MQTTHYGYILVVSDTETDWAMYVRPADYEHIEDAVSATASSGLKLTRDEAEVMLKVLRYLEPAPAVKVENYRTSLPARFEKEG